LDYRLVASPRATALRSIFVCFSACALLSCAGASPGKTGSGGNNGSGGSNGSGGNSSSGGNNGSGGSSSSGGNSASGGSNGSGGNVSSGGSNGSGGSSASGGNNGSGGSTSSGGSNGSGGSSSSGGATGAGGSVVTNTDGGGSDATCQTADFTWAPQYPSVLILVDRSGSEFTDMTDGVFFTLRTAVEAVVANLDSQVRFGVASFVGDHASGACKLDYLSVPIALNNSAAIKTAYDGWGPLLPYGSKADTPAVEAIPMVQAALQADSGTGKKYMMLVSDGETDFCDDGNALCPADAVTALIQDMYSGTPSIGTLVVGLGGSDSTTTVSQALLNFANAGVGQPVTIPTGIGASTGMDVYNQCNGQGTAAMTSSWSSLLTAAGKSMTSIANYGTTEGTATVFAPSSTSETDLENAISAAISGVKSCSFDLSDVGGKSIKVDLTKLALADITIQGTTIPQDATNGWSMSSSTELVLNGTACATWRMPNVSMIHFGFPCSAIIFE
jgi:hypothetical protein